jgi:hypothetical protein
MVCFLVERATRRNEGAAFFNVSASGAELNGWTFGE